MWLIDRMGPIGAFRLARGTSTPALGFAALGAVLFLGANEAQTAAMLADHA